MVFLLATCRRPSLLVCLPCQTKQRPTKGGTKPTTSPHRSHLCAGMARVCTSHLNLLEAQETQPANHKAPSPKARNTFPSFQRPKPEVHIPHLWGRLWRHLWGSEHRHLHPGAHRIAAVATLRPDHLVCHLSMLQMSSLIEPPGASHTAKGFNVTSYIQQKLHLLKPGEKNHRTKHMFPKSKTKHQPRAGDPLQAPKLVGSWVARSHSLWERSSHASPHTAATAHNPPSSPSSEKRTQSQKTRGPSGDLGGCKT